MLDLLVWLYIYVHVHVHACTHIYVGLRYLCNIAVDVHKGVGGGDGEFP